MNHQGERAKTYLEQGDQQEQDGVRSNATGIDLVQLPLCQEELDHQSQRSNLVVHLEEVADELGVLGPVWYIEANVDLAAGGPVDQLDQRYSCASDERHLGRWLLIAQHASEIMNRVVAGSADHHDINVAAQEMIHKELMDRLVGAARANVMGAYLLGKKRPEMKLPNGITMASGHKV